MFSYGCENRDYAAIPDGIELAESGRYVIPAVVILTKDSEVSQMMAVS